MLKNWKSILLLFLVIAGAALIVYLFAKEDVQNLVDTLTGNIVEIPVEEEPAQETLLLSLFHASIDFDGQMEKLRADGFENNFFIATVANVDTDNQKVTLEMSFPTNGGYETEEKVASSSCPVESTTVIAQENMELVAEKEDIFNWVEKDDLLVSYCLDSTCSSIGKECILIKIKSNAQ